MKRKKTKYIYIITIYRGNNTVYDSCRISCLRILNTYIESEIEEYYEQKYQDQDFIAEILICESDWWNDKIIIELGERYIIVDRLK
jgi:hypothetical protein